MLEISKKNNKQVTNIDCHIKARCGAGGKNGLVCCEDVICKGRCATRLQVKCMKDPRTRLPWIGNNVRECQRGGGWLEKDSNNVQ